MIEARAKTNEKVADAIKTILNELNGGNRKEIGHTIFETVTQDHRTLQQAFWSAMLLAQIEYASNASDLRNEMAVALAGEVKKIVTDHTAIGREKNANAFAREMKKLALKYDWDAVALSQAVMDMAIKNNWDYGLAYI